MNHIISRLKLCKGVYAAVLLTFGLSACSWQDAVIETTQAPQYIRLQEHISVETPPRFRLAHAAKLAISTSENSPEVWQNAARAGIQKVFLPGDDLDHDYYLDVLWPAQPNRPGLLSDVSFNLGGHGALALPGMPAQQALGVKLHDASGQLIANMTLHISPQAWGPVWQDPGLLEQSFTHLATVLQGR